MANKSKKPTSWESCPFCGLPGERVDAHIIPAAFFKDIALDGHVLRERSPSSHPQRRPIGVYDSDLWCAECETRYGKWDTYAIECLRSPFEDLDSCAKSIPVDRPDELRLFFISMLWRASATTKPLFRQVSLGKFAARAKRLLESGAPGPLDTFATVVSWSGDNENLIAEPAQVRRSGVRFYRFYLGRVMADIKVSSQATPSCLQPAVIGQAAGVIPVLQVPRDRGLIKAAATVAKQLLR